MTFKINGVETTHPQRVKCPFCCGDGCCHCDHEGYVFYQDSLFFKKDRNKKVIVSKQVENSEPKLP